MENTPLFKKVYGCLLGGAIGDALGGPVEHLSPEAIRTKYGGNLDRMVAYEREPAHHAHFNKAPGSYTDDTRLKHLFCAAIFRAGGHPRPGDLAYVMADAYHNAPDELQRGFVEEYYMKTVWGRDKVVFAGEPTNGALMANSPLGLIMACRNAQAYQLGFDLSFFTDGHAKTAAAMMVTAIAAAMKPTATVDSIIEAVETEHMRFARRREGDHWHLTEWRYDPNLQFLKEALKIAHEHQDVFAIREPLMAMLEWGHLFSESIHTLCVALAMFVASDADFKQALIGAVMYGRDKDSYASVVGALIGALHGVDALPQGWIAPVIAANPEVDMKDYARRLTNLVLADTEQIRLDLNELEKLL